MISQLTTIAMQNPILLGGGVLLSGTILITLLKGLLDLGFKLAKVGAVLLVIYGGIQYAGIV